MDEFCHTQHFFLADTYSIADELASFGVYSCTGLLILYQMINLFLMIFAREAVKFSLHFQKTFIVTIFLGFAYTLLLVTLFIYTYSISYYKLFEKKSTRERWRNSLCRCIAYLLLPYEYLVYELKTVTLVLYTLNNDMIVSISNTYTNTFTICIYCILIVDYIFTITISLFKCQFLRQEVSDGSYFSRMPCNFEVLYVISLPFLKICSLYTNALVYEGMYDLDMIFLAGQNSVNLSYYLIELCILIVLLVVYFRELPYFHSTCERCIGHLVCSSLVIHASIGITNYSHTMMAKIVCLVMPLQIVFIEIFLRAYVYEDRLDVLQSTTGGGGVTNNKIKMILTGQLGKDSKNALSTNFLKSLLRRSYMHHQEEKIIWSNMMEESELGMYQMLRRHGIDAKSVKCLNTDKYKSYGNSSFHETDIKNDIYYMMVSKFVQENNYSQITCMMKIDWMLKKKFIFLEILNLLNRVLSNQDSFKAKYVCFYCLKLVEKTLGFFYRMKEQSENGYKDLNNVGLDLETVLVYKNQVAKLTQLVEKFSTIHKKNIQTIMSDNAPLKVIYQSETELYGLHQVIQNVFNSTHEHTLKTEYFHLIPYFYHLLYNVNLYRSSKRIYQLFYTRFLEVKKNYIDVTQTKLNNLSVLYRSTTFLCDSDQRTLSLIRNVYGKKSNKYMRCIDKYPDVILPKVQNQYHYQAMHSFMMSDNTKQIKNINIGFTRMPNDNFITRSIIIIKIAPNLKKEFKFMVSLMEEQNSDEYYIIVSQNFYVDSYSKNLTKLIPRKLLVPGVHLSKISKLSAYKMHNIVSQIKDTFLDTRSKATLTEAKSSGRTGTMKTAAMLSDQEVYNTGKFQEMANQHQEFVEELTFGEGTNKPVTRKFQVKINYNAFRYISGGYYSLKLRDIIGLKQGDIKKRPKKLFSRAIEDNLLNFNNIKTDAVGGPRRYHITDDSIQNSMTQGAESERMSRYEVDSSDNSPHHRATQGNNYQSKKSVMAKYAREPDMIHSASLHQAEKPSFTIDFKMSEKINAPSKKTKTGGDNPLTDHFQDISKTDSKLFKGQAHTNSALIKVEKMDENLNNSEIPEHNLHDVFMMKQAEKQILSMVNDYKEGSSDTDDISIEVNISENAKIGRDMLRDAREENRLAAGTSVVTADTQMGYQHNKMIFEDVCTRSNAPFEIIFTRGHFLSSVLFVLSFVVSIMLICYDVNSSFEEMNEFYLSYYDFKFNVGQLTNRYLYKYGLDTNKFSEDRYRSIIGDMNFTSDNQNEINGIVDKFDYNFKVLIDNIVKSEKKISNLLFSQRMNLSSNFIQQAVNSSSSIDKKPAEVVKVEYSIIESFVVETYSKISRLDLKNISNLVPFYYENKDDLISKGYVLIAQYFQLYDTLNEHPFGNIESIITQEMLDKQDDTLNIILFLMFAAIFLNICLACIQFLLVRNLTKKIFRAFSAFHLISDFEYAKRMEQLESVKIIMKDIEDNNFMVQESHQKHNFKNHIRKLKREKSYSLDSGRVSLRRLALQETTLNDINNNRNKRVRYSKDVFMFNLTNSFFIILLKSFTILGFILVVYFQLANRIIKKTVLFKKEIAINDLSMDILLMQNYFVADYLFNNEKLLLHRQMAKGGIDTYYRDVSDRWFNNLEFLFGDSKEVSLEFQSDFRSKSSCEFISELSSFVGPSSKPVCQYGSLKIPQKSMYLALVGMYRKILDYYTVLNKSSSHPFKQIEFNEQKTIEWEFYMLKIFYPTKDRYVKLVKREFEDNYSNTDPYSIRLIVLWTIIFFTFYSIFSSFAVINITRQIRVSRFSFQIYNMKAVLDNNKVKTRFIEFFKISNREFI